MQAEGRACDGQPRAQHHVRRSAEHGVVRGFSVLTCAACLLISADQEDGVVSGRGYRKGDEQVGRERGQLDDVVEAEEGDEPAGGGEFEDHHEEHQHDRHDRSVDEQQHQDDDRERDDLDELHAVVAGDLLVGGERRRTRHVGLHPGRGRDAVDDRLGGFDRFIGQGLALVACEVHLDVGGLAVVAL